MEHVDITKSLDSTPVQPKYGPTGDGGYDTPYETTIFYNVRSVFQIAVAALSEMGQAIPISEYTDLSILGESCEHPSPNLILFDDQDYTPELLKKYFARGFQKISIFAHNLPTDDCQSTESIENSSRHLEGTAINIKALSEIDARISLFSLDDMSPIKLISNLNTVYIFDLIACGTYPEYKSFMRNITHERGQEFIKYLQSTCSGAGHVGNTLLKLAVTFGGYEMAEAMCNKYQGMVEARTQLARKRIEVGHVHDGVLFVYGGDLRNEMFAQAMDTPHAKHVVYWTPLAESKDIFVTVARGGGWKEGDATPYALLSNHGTCSGSDKSSIVEGRLVEEKKKFIPWM